MERGILLAVRGAVFRRLAEKAARSIRAVCGEVPIDLFTDAPVDETLFDRIVILPAEEPSPKLAALGQSRFERTIYLDADTLAVADFTDLFDVLDTHHLVLALDQMRACNAATLTWRKPIPAAYPQFNGGMIAYRRDPLVDAVFADWRAAYAAQGIGKDQPSLRELLFDSDARLKVAVAPEEYNLWDLKRLDAMGFDTPAPRIIHTNLFKRPKVLAADGEELRLVLGHSRLARLELLLANDPTLHPGGDRRDRQISLAQRAWLKALSLRDLPRRLRVALGFGYP